MTEMISLQGGVENVFLSTSFKITSLGSPVSFKTFSFLVFLKKMYLVVCMYILITFFTQYSHVEWELVNLINDNYVLKTHDLIEAVSQSVITPGQKDYY